MVLPLITMSADGETTVFTLEDCPKLVDDELFYLANKPGTALLRKDSIFKGSDMFALNGERIFEGDVLKATEEGAVYFVQLCNGFKLRGQCGSLRPPDCSLIRLGHWLALRGEIEIPQWLDRHFTESKHCNMRYMVLSQETVFSLFDVITVSGQNVLVNRGGGTIATLDDIGQFSGIRHPSGRGYYYGQQLKGVGNVTMHSGEPGVLTSTGFKAFGNAEFRKMLENASFNDFTN